LSSHFFNIKVKEIQFQYKLESTKSNSKKDHARNILAELVNNHNTQQNKNTTEDQSFDIETIEHIMILTQVLYT
jgi:hypothetical protein